MAFFISKAPPSSIRTQLNLDKLNLSVTSKECHVASRCVTDHPVPPAPASMSWIGLLLDILAFSFSLAASFLEIMFTFVLEFCIYVYTAYHIPVHLQYDAVPLANFLMIMVIMVILEHVNTDLHGLGSPFGGSEGEHAQAAVGGSMGHDSSQISISQERLRLRNGTALEIHGFKSKNIYTNMRERELGTIVTRTLIYFDLYTNIPKL